MPNCLALRVNYINLLLLIIGKPYSLDHNEINDITRQQSIPRVYNENSKRDMERERGKEKKTIQLLL